MSIAAPLEATLEILFQPALFFLGVLRHPEGRVAVAAEHLVSLAFIAAQGKVGIADRALEILHAD